MGFLDKCATYVRAQEIIDAGAYPYFPVISARDGPVVSINGNQKAIMLGSNAYTGLVDDARVQAAAKAAVQQYGTSMAGSRLFNGTTELHCQLERELADWFGYPAALVFSTGYATNLGVLSALARRDPGDAPRFVILDAEAHASLLDGAGLGFGTFVGDHRPIRRFRHNDPAALSARLADLPPSSDSLVVVEGTYSMNGQIAPLSEIARVCRHHGAALLVDDAHGAGVLADGRGTCAYYALTAAEVDILTVTFSKAFASTGGAVLGSEELIHYLRHTSRPLLFSASLSPADTAAALAALRIIRTEPWRTRRPVELAEAARTRLLDLGFTVLGRRLSPSRCQRRSMSCSPMQVSWSEVCM